MTADERLILAQVNSLTTILGVTAQHFTDQAADLVYAWEWLLKQNGGKVPDGFKFPSDKSTVLSATPVTLTPKAEVVA